MIKLNNRDCLWQEGMTVTSLMKVQKFVYPRIVVKINGEFIEPEDYEKTFIHDGDDVLMIHLMAGG